ncbi:hypothetical protein FE257_011208 [Aspergillus nanangensis]|uniref:Uncharacterized protein n=1 Tax=Aspergillus nanangensis TaxID=2582783 RepID=A0AAD4GQT8_ASPNN|nr:hypothetical protein FE257_011208 [Aspergillus nanangensis]
MRSLRKARMGLLALKSEVKRRPPIFRSSDSDDSAKCDVSPSFKPGDNPEGDKLETSDSPTGNKGLFKHLPFASWGTASGSRERSFPKTVSEISTEADSDFGTGMYRTEGSRNWSFHHIAASGVTSGPQSRDQIRSPRLPSPLARTVPETEGNVPEIAQITESRDEVADAVVSECNNAAASSHVSGLPEATSPVVNPRVVTPTPSADISLLSARFQSVASGLSSGPPSGRFYQSIDPQFLSRFPSEENQDSIESAASPIGGGSRASFTSSTSSDCHGSMKYRVLSQNRAMPSHRRSEIVNTTDITSDSDHIWSSMGNEELGSLSLHLASLSLKDEYFLVDGKGGGHRPDRGNNRTKSEQWAISDDSTYNRPGYDRYSARGAQEIPEIIGPRGPFAYQTPRTFHDRDTSDSTDEYGFPHSTIARHYT